MRAAGGPHSVFPDAFAPQLFCNAWSGAPRQETGRPESVYSLDKAGLTQLSTTSPMSMERLELSIWAMADGL